MSKKSTKTDATLKKLTQQVKKLTKENEELKKKSPENYKILELHKENKNVKAKNVRLTKKSEKLTEKNKELTAENKEYKRLANNYNKKHKNYTTTLAKHLVQITELKKRVKTLEKEKSLALSSNKKIKTKFDRKMNTLTKVNIIRIILENIILHICYMKIR